MPLLCSTPGSSGGYCGLCRKELCASREGELCAAWLFVIQLATMDVEQGKLPLVGAVVLAAGGSLRMGQLKQLLEVAGQPMARRVVQVVGSAGVDQVVVVVGAHADAVKQALEGLAVQIVRNRHWADGMSGSLRVGVGALRRDIQAAFIVLADQPGLTSELLRSLLARYHATNARIIAPFYEGRRGNPVLFDRALFVDLQALEGDKGAREFLALHEDWVERVDVDNPAVLLDVDTPRDYRRLDI
jgi:molybdenum cofactor cytidylyltransferase